MVVVSKHDDFNCIVNVHILSFPVTASSWCLGWLAGKDKWTPRGKVKGTGSKTVLLGDAEPGLNSFLLRIIFFIVK